MSSAPLAFAPLPYDADPGAAFTDTIVLPAVGRVGGGGQYFTVPVPGEYFYYPLSLAANLVTSAAIATRLANYVLLDQNNAEIVRQGQVNGFAASGNFGLAWQISVGAAYTDGSSEFYAPLPPRLLLPTYSVGVIVTSIQAGDSLVGQVTVIKIPRRRPINPLAAVAVTPAQV